MARRNPRDVPTYDGGAPVLPGVDPFHDAPAELAELSPGSVIRARRVRLGFLGLIPQRRLRAWQIAYRSTDLDGRPEVAVTTVVLPHGAPPRGVIAYQCAIDAVADRCFPSYALRYGARAWGALPQLELVLIAYLLARGFALSIADHEGRAGNFAAPREPGHRVLDGLRATFALRDLDLDPALRIGLIGYSGGGMATAWAAELAPDYAPELPLAGAVLGSPVGDPGEAFIKLNGTRLAGLPALVVAGLRHVYPGLARVVAERVHAEGLSRLDALEQMTTVQAIWRHRYDDFDDYVDGPLADVLATPEILEVFDDLRLGGRAPACPLLVVQSAHDQVIDVRDIDSHVARYVDGGAAVRYLRDRLSEHNSLLVLGFPAMVGWLEERFAAGGADVGDSADVAGGADAEGRIEDRLSLALEPRSWPGFARLAGAATRTVLGVA